MSNTDAEELLSEIPDFSSWERAIAWIEERKRPLDASQEAQFRSLEWSDIIEPRSGVFGLYSVENWRKFVLATFLADVISYSNPSDQVNFDRLLFVMHAFPQGFRTWWMKGKNKPWRPVGYTAWYPMLETMFETFEKHPEKLKSRMVVPHILEQGPLIYLFNFSVAPALKKQPLTKVLMTQFADDIKRQNPQGLACITVSEDGMRIAKRFGMTRSGYMGEEGVFVTTRPK